MSANETGGTVTALLQVVVVIGLVLLVGHEAMNIAITTINLEDRAQEVAQVTARAYRSDQRVATAEETARSAAEQREVSLVDVRLRDDTVVVEVRARARTLVAHRLFEDLVVAEATGRARWR